MRRFDQFEFELEFELLDELVEVLVDVLPFVLLSRSRSLSLLQDPPEQLFDVDFDELDDFEVDTDFVPTRMISPSPATRFAGACGKTGAACTVNAMSADAASAVDAKCQRPAIALLLPKSRHQPWRLVHMEFEHVQRLL